MEESVNPTMRNVPIHPLIAWLILASHSFAADLEWIRFSNNLR